MLPQARDNLRIRTGLGFKPVMKIPKLQKLTTFIYKIYVYNALGIPSSWQS